MVSSWLQKIRSPIAFILLVTLCALLSGCVSTKQALLVEKRANSPLMKGIQDNDEDIVQIEDGTGAVGEAAACPT